MIEKVNMFHPDKVADRIASALVDLAYKKQENPKAAVEVLIGHGKCHIINETSAHLENNEVENIVKRIGGKNIEVDYVEVPQDVHLAKNQKEEVRCGDNGIFKGMPITEEQFNISAIAKHICSLAKTDGKYILDGKKLIVCQSCMPGIMIEKAYAGGFDLIVNPLGDWTGGSDVDSGATNRKLGSDMADSVTGGGLWGKDCSKADVSANITAFLLAQENKCPVTACCAIGDKEIKFNIEGKEPVIMSYKKVVETAKKWIDNKGGFEKASEWGLY